MKVILFMVTSLNGMIATSDGKEDFLSHANWLEFVRLVKKHKCFIWGRKTYQAVSKWDKSYLAPLKGSLALVISRNKKIKLAQDFTAAASPNEALKLAKKHKVKTVILTGGATNNSSFADKGLIDEVMINVEGVLVGKGVPLFKPDNFHLPLQLKKITKITGNIIKLHYRVKTK